MVRQAGRDVIGHIFELADVYHCLPFEQSCAEFIEKMGGLAEGKRDLTQYDTVPAFTSIGKDYAYLIYELHKSEGRSYIDLIMEVFDSFFSRAVSDFDSSFFYENLSYHLACYKEGKVLD